MLLQYVGTCEQFYRNVNVYFNLLSSYMHLYFLSFLYYPISPLIPGISLIAIICLYVCQNIQCSLTNAIPAPARLSLPSQLQIVILISPNPLHISEKFHCSFSTKQITCYFLMVSLIIGSELLKKKPSQSEQWEENSNRSSGEEDDRQGKGLQNVLTLMQR